MITAACYWGLQDYSRSVFTKLKKYHLLLLIIRIRLILTDTPLRDEQLTVFLDVSSSEEAELLALESLTQFLFAGACEVCQQFSFQRKTQTLPAISKINE